MKITLNTSNYEVNTPKAATVFI